jgi:hypothetical protein
MGYGVEVHPALGVSRTRPDFLLTRHGDPFAVVEARLAGLPTDKATSAKRLEGELYDALDRVRSPNFFLHVEDIKTAPVRPSFKQLIRDVEAWLETLDPDIPIEAFRRRNSEIRFVWKHDGWSLSLQVIPRSPEHRGKAGGRAVGIFSAECRWLDPRGELRRALSDKAGKYGDLGLPFIIAINYLGVHCDRDDWTDVLYGTSAVKVRFAEDGTHFQQPFRKNDGFWIREGKPCQTQISAVIGGRHISPWSMGAHPLEMYAHYSIEHPIDLDGNLPCWHVPTGKNELVMRQGRSSAEILELPKGWPDMAEIL